MLRFSTIAASLLLGLAASLRADPSLPVTQRISSTQEWRDAEGKAHKPLANEQQRATVIVFVMHDCPLTNKSAPELNRLVEEFGNRGVRFYRIYGDETDEQIRKHGSDFGLSFPGLRDPEMALAQITSATRAPEAVLISPEGELLYRGRIDDRAIALGKVRPVAKRRDLHLAIAAALDGKRPETRFAPAVGCYLNVPDESEVQTGAANPS